ncbi:MAG TPA: CotH kinase family protein, partial [Planctomycetota bacterium]|nr:CotH kinase family protein [Planctomycetota bacterium]
TNSPEYLGTMIQASGVTSALRVFHWFVQSPVLAETAGGTRASIFWDGTLYDNVHVRLRGQTSASYPKKSFKFDFNSGYHCAWSSAVPAVEEVNLNTTWADKAYVRQEISYEVYDLMGAPGSVCETVRVQQNGSFYSVAAYVEQPDERMLLREGLSERGALYKMYNTLDSSINGVEKKSRLYENNADLSQLVTAISGTGTTLENWLFDNVNIPAVLNYLVATTLILDNDHVHKNYYVYRDSEGSLEWLFLPWDKDLTLGRNFTLSGGVLNDTMYSNQDPQAHPLFGDSQHPKVDGPWNRLIDAVYRTPRLRAMYLRRLRTGMDRILNAPGTPSGARHYESRIAAMQAQMGPDVILDQAAWGVPSWGSPLNFSAAIGQLLTSHLDPRRVHLYVTHGGGTQPLIPPAQPTAPALVLGAVDAQPASGIQAEEYVQIINCAADAVDLSDYILSAGSVFAVLPKGLVVPPSGSVYLSPNVRAFRTRAAAPTGGQGHFVVKAYTGDLQASVPIQLLTPTGTLV